MVAATDYGGKFLNTSTPVINSAWIIDFGATDHMTFDSKQISPLRHFSQKIVFTANGNTTPVIGERSLTLTDTLNLNSILVVPSLNYNLLSISQITATLSCIVIFWLEFCVLRTSKQDRRLVVVLSGENFIIWTYSQRIQISCDKS